MSCSHGRCIASCCFMQAGVIREKDAGRTVAGKGVLRALACRKCSGQLPRNHVCFQPEGGDTICYQGMVTLRWVKVDGQRFFNPGCPDVR